MNPVTSAITEQDRAAKRTDYTLVCKDTETSFAISLPENPTCDEIIEELEKHGLGWDVGKCCRLVEARIWDWPFVICRYRPIERMTVAEMLMKAITNNQN